MSELTQLVQAAQQGDRAAFGQIVTRFQDMAFAGAYAVLGDPHAAQDAAQEAFLEAYRTLGKLREPAAFPVRSNGCCSAMGNFVRPWSATNSPPTIFGTLKMTPIWSPISVAPAASTAS